MPFGPGGFLCFLRGHSSDFSSDIRHLLIIILAPVGVDIVYRHQYVLGEQLLRDLFLQKVQS